MNVLSKLGRRTLGLAALAAALDGCAGGAPQRAFLPAAAPPPIGPAEHAQNHRRASGHYVYVINRTKEGTSQLLVYPAGVANPAPVQTIAQGIADAAGVAVDNSGNVFVANGSAGNVLEFAPGGTSLIKTYTVGLVHPIAVTVAGSTLYISDQGSPRNGYVQQVFEYQVGGLRPTIGIGGLGALSQLNEGIAVNSVGSDGKFYVADSTLTAFPPTGKCPSNGAFTIGENILPTLWQLIPLAHNQQASGLAFDANGNLYAADPCANDVVIYSRVNYQWIYSATVPGRFSSPLFLTIANQFLAVPSSGGSGSGYVTVIDLNGLSPTVTIGKHLQHPIGAAVGIGS